MNQERWKRIDDIYNKAMDLQPGRREAFVNEACAGNEELLDQINRLLESSDQESGFLDSPAIEIAAKAIANDREANLFGETTSRVFIKISTGKRQGKTLVFTEHKICVFGRANDCYEVLPDDERISRHHFMLEATPPNISIQDLKSRNGTFVIRNARQDKVALHSSGSPIMQLHHGDRIQIGGIILEISVETPALCAICGQNTRLNSFGSSKKPAPAALCDDCLAGVLHTIHVSKPQNC
jgi:pSer/pThr/pTyr-binding forkhead associated (FHA) protein